jgi:hypothetical protein
MAFTEAQRVQIRHSLGYPDVFLDSNMRLESAMDVLGARVEASAEVVSILAEIAAARLALRPSSVDALHSRAGIKQVDEVQFFGDARSASASEDSMRKTGRTWVSELSVIFGVPIAHDIFSSGGYRDDSWMGVACQGGGPLRLG